MFTAEIGGFETIKPPAEHGWWRQFILIVSSIFILYHVLYISDLLVLFTPVIIPPNTHLGIHLAAILFLTFLLVRVSKGAATDKPPIYDIILAFAALVIPLYYATHFNEIFLRAGEGTVLYSIFGWILSALLLEATRRTLGTTFTCVVAFFLVYPLVSGYFPGVLYHPGFSFLWLGEYNFMSYEGIFSFVLGIAANIVVVFLLFSQMLIHSGAGEFFIDLARSAFGAMRGGPAKMAIIASACFGTLSGCPVGNVAATGTFTIPLMKKTGYAPHYAGAVEAVASLGGMLMPPIMGAIIFILADFIEMPYIQVIKHAAIPAVLYYLALYVMVDQEAVRLGLKGLSKATLPPLMRTIKRGWWYAIPVIVLLYLMAALLYTPQKAIIWSLVSLLILSMFRKDTRLGPKRLATTSEETVRSMVSVTLAMACSGIIIGAVSVTGVGVNISRALVEISGGNLLILLILTAITSFILGMGVGPTGCYVFLAIMVVPSLETVGVPLIAAHLFVVYWALVSLITPPVAVVSFVAAGLAGAKPFKLGWQASRLALIAYVVPFAFVYEPPLLAVGAPAQVVIAVGSAVIGTIGLALGTGGHFMGELNWLRRVMCLGGSALLLFFNSWSFMGIGACVLAVALLWQWLLKRARSSSEISNTA